MFVFRKKQISNTETNTVLVIMVNHTEKNLNKIVIQKNLSNTATPISNWLWPYSAGGRNKEGRKKSYFEKWKGLYSTEYETAKSNQQWAIIGISIFMAMNLKEAIIFIINFH